MSFFYVILGFPQSRWGELGDIPGFIQLLPGSYKSDKPIKITEIDKILFKRDCINGSIVNRVREAILYFLHCFRSQATKFTKNQEKNFLKK